MNIFDHVPPEKKEEMKRICRFIHTSTVEEATCILVEILCHHAMFIWDDNVNELHNIEIESIQDDFIIIKKDMNAKPK